MGNIVSSRQLTNKKVIIKFLTESQDFKNIKGNMKNIHFFSENKCTKEACLKERGNNKTTKYVEIPLTLRPRKKNYQKLSYQRIESPKDTYYIYGLMRK